MRNWLRDRLVETWEELRARMITETSTYLTQAMKHPELGVRIPTIQAGSGSFPPSLSRAFWEPVLSE